MRETCLQIDILAANGNPFGALLHLRYENTLAMYLMAIDKEYNPKISIGNVLIGLCITSAIRNGIEVYDFLKGCESYKFHWSNDGKSSVEMLFWQRRMVPVISGLTRLAKHAGKMILR